jgi:hypothetical protein
MDSRKQFEKWYSASWGEAGGEPLNSFNLDERGQYTDTYVHEFWTVWKASRSELLERAGELNWAPSVLQELIGASGVEPC